MKKIIVSIMAMMAIMSAMAQVPQKMSYQAVIRNNNNQLVVNQNVGIKISILHGSTNGTVVYTEFHTTSTNKNGLVSIAIGGGIGFDAIDWANGPFYIKAETDPNGGSAYAISAVSQLLSVPYALYAKNSLTPGPKGDKGDPGERGPQGPKGDKGDPGGQGVQGVQGPQGIKGDKGDQGVQGPQGLKGDKGDQGVQGPQGMKGDKGDQGAQGPQGMKGDKGDPGEQGPQGAKGDKGDLGEQGPQGVKGDKGDRGEQGVPGDTKWDEFTGGISFSGGNVGIGTSNPGYLFHIHGRQTNAHLATIRNDGNNSQNHGLAIACGSYAPNVNTTYAITFYDGDFTAVGSITYKNGVVQYNTTSDRSLKTGIVPSSIKGINMVRNMPVVDFEFRQQPGKMLTGFIAQDIEKVYPEAISIGDDGILHLSLPALVPVLTKAIQEQQEQIDYSLQKDIDSLKTEMTELKKANEILIQAGAMLSEENELMRNQIKQIMALLAGSF